MEGDERAIAFANTTRIANILVALEIAEGR